PPPAPSGDPQPTVAPAGTVGPTQERRVGSAMLKLLVVGSVALDSVKTPFGEQSEVLGGSAAFFATAASYFTPVSLIAVVGEDFPEVHLKFLRMRGIDDRTGATSGQDLPLAGGVLPPTQRGEDPRNTTEPPRDLPATA